MLLSRLRQTPSRFSRTPGPRWPRQPSTAPGGARGQQPRWLARGHPPAPTDVTPHATHSDLHRRACTHSHTRIHTHAHSHAHTHALTHALTCTHTRAPTCTCTHALTCTRALTHTRTRAHSHALAHVHTQHGQSAGPGPSTPTATLPSGLPGAEALGTGRGVQRGAEVGKGRQRGGQSVEARQEKPGKPARTAEMTESFKRAECDSERAEQRAGAVLRHQRGVMAASEVASTTGAAPHCTREGAPGGQGPLTASGIRG